jgi:Spy/CpxP family protein refolding chaperone
MKKVLFASLLAGVFAAASLAQEQGGPGGPGGPPDQESMAKMRVENLATQLKLTAAQKTAASAIYAKSSAATAAIQENLRNTRQSLQEAIKKNDAEAIAKLASTVGTLTAQMTVAESTAEAELYKSLTEDQRARYDAMPRGGRGGFGGPMGGPPGGR